MYCPLLFRVPSHGWEPRPSSSGGDYYVSRVGGKDEEMGGGGQGWTD